jgi:predicted MFS family arabinose efflux permease
VFTVIFNVFGWPAMSMVPVIGSDYLHLDPKGVGLLASAEGIGGLVGAVLIGSLVRPQWYARIYGGAVATYLIVVAAFATAPLPWIAGVALFLCGASTVAFSVLQATLVYRDSPVEMRSRLLGVLSVFIGTSPIGFLYLGVLADLMTSRIAVVALAAQGMLVLLLARRYWLPVMRVREVRE